jgi:hypothetical protein|nr:MAG TPA: hypothetical protein [Caudoviricetes sp.]
MKSKKEYSKKIEKCYVCEGTGMHFGGNCCCDGTGSDVVRRQNQKSYNAKNGLPINQDVKPDALEYINPRQHQ